ncbi:MAG: CBS domain-containing protein [Candidatus Methanomethylicus sp.]|nr:CBS domain-containing protein [Candidatus Methanomethylicus sp.]
MTNLLKDPMWKHTRRELHFVDATSNVTETAQKMKQNEVASILVSKDDIAIGIVTQKDILNKIVAEGKDPKIIKVSEIMSTPLITIGKNEPLEKALELMKKYNTRRILVVDEKGKPYGLSVELKICGDLLDSQLRMDALKSTSWLEQHIIEVTDYELKHHPEIEEETTE